MSEYKRTESLAAARPLLWTATEFNSLGSLGAFLTRRAFLLDGVIWEQGLMSPAHANGIERVARAMHSAFGAGYCCRCQMPLHTNEMNDPYPDIAVLAGSPRDWTAHPTTALLVIEVADNSVNVDRNEKAERYASANVPDYWILDVTGHFLHVFRDPVPLPAGLGATAYRQHTTFGPADTVSPLAAPSAIVRVADMLP